MESGLGPMWNAYVIWSYLPIIGAVIVHIAFSAAIFNDARNIKEEGAHVAFVGPTLWSFAVLVGGIFVALAYWVIHHSALNKH